MYFLASQQCMHENNTFNSTCFCLQPYDAMRMILNIEKFLSGKSQSSQDKDKDKNDSSYAAAQEALKAKLTLVILLLIQSRHK